MRRRTLGMVLALGAGGALAGGAATVEGPVQLVLGLQPCAPVPAGATGFTLDIAAIGPLQAPAGGWRVELAASGVARLLGPASFALPARPAPFTHRLCGAFVTAGRGAGALSASMAGADPRDPGPWRPQAVLFLLQAPDTLLASPSSMLEAWRAWLERERRLGRISAAEHDRLQTRLLERGSLAFE